MDLWQITSTALGARVIAAAGSQVKIDIAKKYGGAEHGVNYTNKGWQQEVLKLTGGKGVDVVYDPVGLITGGWSLRNPHGHFSDASPFIRLSEVYCLERPGASDRLCRWYHRKSGYRIVPAITKRFHTSRPGTNESCPPQKYLDSWLALGSL